MGKSMRKFKKLAVLAITIPTLLSSTNISFAMESNRQQSAFSPASSDSYEVTYSNEFDMKQQSAFSPYLSNNYEIICSSQSQEEDIYTSSKSIKSPDEEKYKSKYDTVLVKEKKRKSREEEYIECTNPDCKTYGTGEKCARLNRTNNLKNGTTHKTYYCKKCKKYFTLDENGKNVKKEHQDCLKCGREKCACPYGTYKLRNGTKMQQYKCRKCRRCSSRPINKNAEE